MKRSKRPKVEGLWLVYDPGTYDATKPGSIICGANPINLPWFEEHGYIVTKNPPCVEFRYLGQKSVPDVSPGMFKNQCGVPCYRIDGFWYFPVNDFTQWEWGREGVYWRMLDPRTQARWDVEYEQFCGREVPPEVLADPWLYPSLYHKGE